MRTKKIILLLLSSFIFCSCGNKVVYSHYISLPEKGWHMDSLCSYTINNTDTVNPYEVLLLLRHTEDYKYQNLWLEIEYSCDTQRLTKDTLEVYLATNRGDWLGNKKNQSVEMPVLLKHEFVFAKPTMQVNIRQLMRDTLLNGICDVLLKVEENKTQKKDN